jgi:hypothetical protein
MTAKTNLAQPTFNSLSWDAPLNSNFGILDNAIGGNLNLSITSANVTLTATQAQNAVISVTGLTAARSLATGANIVGTWVVSNVSSFTLSVYTTLSTGAFVSIPTNTIVTVYSPDGINMYEANNNTVKKTGDTMTGPLVITSGAAVPINVNSGQFYVTSGSVFTTGNFFANQNVTAFSDIRYKENVMPIDKAVEMVEKMNGVFFTRKEDGSNGVGVIAQEIREVLPEVVVESEDGYLAVAYGNITAVLINAVKELSARVKELESK